MVGLPLSWPPNYNPLSRLQVDRQTDRQTDGEREGEAHTEMTMAHTRDMTIFSRNGSMGGLVTWANNCLKYSNRRGLYWDRQASGASLPIEPSASFLHTRHRQTDRQTDRELTALVRQNIQHGWQWLIPQLQYNRQFLSATSPADSTVVK